MNHTPIGYGSCHDYLKLWVETAKTSFTYYYSIISDWHNLRYYGAIKMYCEGENKHLLHFEQHKHKGHAATSLASPVPSPWCLFCQMNWNQLEWCCGIGSREKDPLQRRRVDRSCSRGRFERERASTFNIASLSTPLRLDFLTKSYKQ